MKKVDIYRAFDGKEFESPEECKNYEENHSFYQFFEDYFTSNTAIPPILEYIFSKKEKFRNCVMEMFPNLIPHEYLEMQPQIQPPFDITSKNLDIPDYVNPNAKPGLDEESVII